MSFCHTVERESNERRAKDRVAHANSRMVKREAKAKLAHQHAVWEQMNAVVRLVVDKAQGTQVKAALDRLEQLTTRRAL